MRKMLWETPEVSFSLRRIQRVLDCLQFRNKLLLMVCTSVHNQLSLWSFKMYFFEMSSMCFFTSRTKSLSCEIFSDSVFPDIIFLKFSMGNFESIGIIPASVF